MRRRIHTHARALLFSLSAVGFTLLATLFFYDGPLEIPHIEASAQATEPAESVEISPLNLRAVQDENPLLDLLPASFKEHWRKVSLDNNRIHLEVLDKPLLLSHTSHQTGSEAFEYGSYLFEQMAKDVQNTDLSGKLKDLSMQAQTMGNAIRQASDFRYDGPPGEDMEHLQVRSNILFYLKGLNPEALITAQYNQDGKLINESPAPKAAQSGEDVQAFLAKVNNVLNHPLARQYPQTMSLLRKQSDVLRNLASHVTLRWESTVYCQQSCGGMATYLRVYTRQSLPAKTQAAVIL